MRIERSDPLPPADHRHTISALLLPATLTPTRRF